MASSSAGNKNKTIIRANPTQTAILKATFALSDKPSREQIKSLSDETKLTPKWVGQWFRRQRMRARKSKPKIPNISNSGPDTSNPCSGFSPQEIFQVKLENAFEGTFLGSASSIVPGSSDYPNLSESMSVTGTTALESVVEHATSGKTMGQLKKKGKAKKLAAIKDKKVVTRTLRSNKTVVAGTSSTAAQATLVKVETMGTPFILRYTPSPVPIFTSANFVDAQVSPNRDVDSGVYPGAKPSNLTNSALGPTFPTISKADYDQMLHNIAPPQRSPIPATKATIYRRTDCRSGFSVNQFDNIHAASSGFLAPLPTGTLPAGRGRGLWDSSSRSSNSQGTAHYQHDPAFRAQFQNNGPSDYISAGAMIQNGSNMLPPVPAVPLNGYVYPDIRSVCPSSTEGSGAPAYYTQPPPPGQYHTLRPLAPAFDWEHHFPEMEFRYPPDESVSRDNIPQTYGKMHPEQMPPTNYPLRNISMDVLNPSLAPLKHLTNVLDQFKGSDGTYAPLFDEHARGKLMGCLLDETLFETNPFQAAMGLSLLSKVGHQWEY